MKKEKESELHGLQISEIRAGHCITLPLWTTTTTFCAFANCMNIAIKHQVARRVYCGVHQRDCETLPNANESALFERESSHATRDEEEWLCSVLKNSAGENGE